MNSNKNGRLEPKKEKTSKIFRTSLALTLVVFAFTMSSPSSYFQIVKPAEAAPLTSVSVVPMSSIVNQRTVYDIFFKTATTATIKTIEVTFPPGFDLTLATKLIEREGIGFGYFSSSGSTLNYTVNNPVKVSAGTMIRLELARIVAENAGSFTASVRTLRGNSQIDGPTSSYSFSIEDIGTSDIAANSVTSAKLADNSVTNFKIADDSITNFKIADNSVTSAKLADNSVTSAKLADNSVTGEDVSTSYTIRKTLHDDTAGHTHGWNPDISTTAFAISDSDISGASTSEFVSVSVRSGNPVFCAAATGDAGLFGVYCDSPPGNSAELDYIITKLPPHDVTSSLSMSSSESTPSSASPSLSSSPHTPALPDIASINRQDDSASEFP